jgi:hypothetical protein
MLDRLSSKVLKFKRATAPKCDRFGYMFIEALFNASM